MESDKEYSYRCLCADIIEFFENNTNNFDELCDCELKNGHHQALCKTNLLRLDMEILQDRIEKIKVT